MMKKIALLLLLGVGLLGMTACQTKEENGEATKETIQSMNKVEEEREQSSEKESSIDSLESEQQAQEEKEEVKKILNYFGDAYANYDSITDRNNKLEKVMTQEAIDANGIGFDSEVMLDSQGFIKNIYQPLDGEKDEYAILLHCIENGSEVRVLLLVKVKGGKISEMTYNTVKQEY